MSMIRKISAVVLTSLLYNTITYAEQSHQKEKITTFIYHNQTPNRALDGILEQPEQHPLLVEAEQARRERLLEQTQFNSEIVVVILHFVETEQTRRRHLQERLNSETLDAIMHYNIPTLFDDLITPESIFTVIAWPFTFLCKAYKNINWEAVDSSEYPYDHPTL